MQFSAMQIATLLGGTIEGNPDAKVTGVSKIEEANNGSLCFLSNAKYEEYLYSTLASVVLINETLKLNKKVHCTLIRVPDAYASFAFLLQKYNEMVSSQEPRGLEQPCNVAASAELGQDVYIGAFTYVSENVKIANNVSIYPNCYIGANVQIGKNSKLFPGVKIYANCIIGANCVIHSGTVVGCDGFGFAPQSDGTYHKIPQIGNVLIEDDVEIGSNCSIDRATMGTTIIKKGTKLDNLIQIAHNVEIGQNTVIAAQTGIAGSSKIGQNCMIGGQVGIIGHIQLADRTNINAQSGVSKSILEPNTVLNGTPAFDYKSVLKSQAIFRHLPEMNQRLIALEKKIESLLNQETGNKDIESGKKD